MRSVLELIVIAGVLLSTTPELVSQELYIGKEGGITFKSNAPLEVISAQSNALKGAINTSSRAFAFTVDVRTFQGFNSRVQRTHFLENYVEAERFPTAIFTGKIIEDFAFDEEGKTVIRAKGLLTVHGVDHERIISGILTREGDSLRAQASFSVLLAEYGITVPKIVHQKVAETIYVHIDIELNSSE